MARARARVRARARTHMPENFMSLRDDVIFNIMRTHARARPEYSPSSRARAKNVFETLEKIYVEGERTLREKNSKKASAAYSGAPRAKS